MAKKVLTIDDSKTLRIIVGRYLKPFGVEILEAENGAIGITKAKEGHPDLILLDYNMPVMDGCQALENLKKDPELRGIPVIMLTTETVRDTVIKLIKMGLKDYIAKPFSREALLEKVNSILQLFTGPVPSNEETAAMAGEPAASPKFASTPPIAQGPVKPTVLVVDDKENVLKLIREYLADGYDVMPALNGHSAISKIQSAKFDWVFLDMDLPDISGVEVYKAAKRNLDERQSKVVGMALRTLVDDVGLARDLGIRDFLYKPFTKANLQAVMNKMMCEAEEGGGQAGHFLTGQGSCRVLRFPENNDPIYTAYAKALGNEIMKEVTDMADEGATRLIIKLSNVLLTDLASVKKLIVLLEHAEKLTIDVRLVAETSKVKEALKEFAETASASTYDSVDLAVAS